MRSRAAVIKMYGGPDVIELVGRPVPEIGPGQVLVRVEAAAVNPVDLATRSGSLAEAGILPRRPVTGLGWDVVGVVEAAAPGPFRVGDRVAGLRDRADLSYGTHADHVVLDQSAIAPVPADADPTVAATVPLNGLTALQALDMLGLTAGQTLLVTGAAGGSAASRCSSACGADFGCWPPRPPVTRRWCGDWALSMFRAMPSLRRPFAARCPVGSTASLMRRSSACERSTRFAVVVPSCP
jgi:D-arabinose 1-dehydrogenase-like Zn-dependent alcohol dehydrogenase